MENMTQYHAEVNNLIRPKKVYVPKKKSLTQLFSLKKTK